jgi:group I intron endonuclease
MDNHNLPDLSTLDINIKCCIYIIENCVTNKQYVGQTKGILKTRIANHIRDFKNHKYNSLLYLSIKKHALENFTVRLLEACEEGELNEKEKYWIKELNTIAPYGYNLTSGGGQGTVYSDELRKTLSQSAKNKDVEVIKKQAAFMRQSYIDNPEKRLFMADIARKAHTGRIQSEEWIEKRVKHKRGKVVSHEQRVNLARAHMNGKVVCCSNGKEYLSSYEAGLDTGADKDKIGLICNGKRKTSCGFSFWYKELE